MKTKITRTTQTPTKKSRKAAIFRLLLCNTKTEKGVKVNLGFQASFKRAGGETER